METAGSRPKDDVSLPKGKKAILLAGISYSQWLPVSAFRLAGIFVEPC